MRLFVTVVLFFWGGEWGERGNLHLYWNSVRILTFRTTTKMLQQSLGSANNIRK